MTDNSSQRLGEQLQKVITTGLTKSEAERAICAGISAGEIRVWQRIEKIDPDGHIMFSYRKRFWSPHLKYLFPEDFDWEKSLFSGRLQKLNHLSPPFQLKQIELSNEGIRRLCFEISLRQAGLQEKGAVGESGNVARSTEGSSGSEGQEPRRELAPAAPNGDRIATPPRRRRKGSPVFDRAHEEIDALFDGHVPKQADLSDPDLCDLVRKNLGERRRKISDATILRAAGRKSRR
jgi:hypothetical protein